MKKLVLALATIGVASSSASAADLPIKVPSVVPALIDWTGVYVGVHAGFGGGMSDWIGGPNADFVASGGLVGGQIGINKQLGSFVFGLEVDGSWAVLRGSQAQSIGGPLFGGTIDGVVNSRVDRFGTFAARAGVAADRWFVFAKTGIAVANERHSLSVTSNTGGPVTTVAASGAETRWGPMVGFGAEYALTGNLSLFGVYDYLHLPGQPFGVTTSVTVGGVTTTAAAQATVEQAIHLVKFGANYRFGWPSSEPRFAPVQPATGTNWSGVYIGSQGGYVGEQETWPPFAASLLGAPGGGSVRSDGWFAGGNGGVNAQAGSFVFGVEGEWMWTGFEARQATVTPFGGGSARVAAETKIDWLAIAGAKAGFVVGDKMLLYAKGGVAIADETHSVSVSIPGPVNPLAGTRTAKAIHTGGVIGVGAEYAFAGNWSAKIEYDYIRMLGQNYTATGNDTVAGPGGATFAVVQSFDRMQQDLHLVKVGVNYRFNAVPAIVARY